SEDFIHWDINIEELILYNVQGRKLALDLPKQKSLDVSSLSKGLYQLQFKWEGEWYHQKLWIQ
ncbi:MAG: T9SS type A sorting domain-containing protein, partial [Croceimicrobium sp.]